MSIKNKLAFLAIVGFAMGSLPVSYASLCMQDASIAAGNNQSLNCTANDVRIASASNIRNLSNSPLNQCVSGQTFSFIADFKVLLTAQARYDIGLYFATDGDGNNDGAYTGICSTNIITPKSGNPALGSVNFINLDPAPDICGDITSNNNPQIVTVQVDNVLCQDTDGDGKLNLPNCTSWRQPGSNQVCKSVGDAYPGSPSKCNCDIGFNVPILVETGTISVVKSVTPASLPEPGGIFTFTVNITNTSQYTDIDIKRICDSDHGLVAKVSTEPVCPAGLLTNSPVIATNCALPRTLSPGSQYSCNFTAKITSKTPIPNEQDTVTVFGVDRSPNKNPVSASGTASISISNVPPSAMVTKSLKGLNCTNVTYTVDVKNTSNAEDLTLTSLVDNAFGDITQVAGAITSTTCTVPQEIAIAGTYHCEFNANFCGASHSNQVTAKVVDDEANEVTPTSDSVIVKVNATQQ